jgi:hypothetical protein
VVATQQRNRVVVVVLTPVVLIQVKVPRLSGA